MSTPSARTGGSLDAWFKISQRGSTVRQEVVAGLTTFLAMVYSVIVVPGMLGKAGFPPAAVFVATCLVAGLGSIVMGLWANLPLAIGCAISLTAFTAFSLVLGQHISVPVALGAVFLMGVLFTVISATGIRSWILRNLPHGVAHGTGIGIGLFLLLIAANGVGLVIKNPLDGLPVALGDFATFPVIMSLVGLAVIIGLEKLKVPGGILLTIIGISIVGLIFDPNVHFSSVFSEKSAIFFCAPAPYCRMPFVLARSIWETKASTMAFCSSDRTESSMTSFFSSGCCTGSSGSGSGVPKLKLGISVVSFTKSFMFSILLFFGTET